MAINDDIRQGLTAHLVDLDKFDKRLIGSIVQILKDAEREILDRLRAIDPASPAALTQRVARLEKLIEQIRGTLGTAYSNMVGEAHVTLREAAAFELDYTNREIGSALAPLSDLVDSARLSGIADSDLSAAIGKIADIADVNTVGVAPQLLRALAEETFVDMGALGAAPVADWFATQEAQTTAAVIQRIRQGVYFGESIEVMARRILGTPTETGILEVSRHWARALARTSVTAVTTRARTDVYDANRDTIKGVYQVSTLDDRTTLICIVYSGKGWIYDADGELIPEGHSLPYNGGTPRHVSCRSTINPWVKSYEEMGLDADEIPDRLQRLFNGKIPAGLDGESRLRKASEALQDTVLGKGKAALWRSGAVKLDQLLDSAGRPLTLAAAKELVT